MSKNKKLESPEEYRERTKPAIFKAEIEFRRKMESFLDNDFKIAEALLKHMGYEIVPCDCRGGIVCDHPQG